MQGVLAPFGQIHLAVARARWSPSVAGRRFRASASSSYAFQSFGSQLQLEHVRRPVYALAPLPATAPEALHLSRREPGTGGGPWARFGHASLRLGCRPGRTGSNPAGADRPAAVKQSGSAGGGAWSRAGARCQPLSWSVSPARSPNRTCGFHRIRLSTNPVELPSLDRHPPVPRCGDSRSPEAVSGDRHRRGVEERHPVLFRPPPVAEMLPSQVLPTGTPVFAAEPFGDSQPRVVVQGTKRRR